MEYWYIASYSFSLLPSGSPLLGTISTLAATSAIVLFSLRVEQCVHTGG
eukprot:COSAG02_NODE_4961_length_4778_cov_3.231246_1_plen_49_part_00